MGKLQSDNLTLTAKPAKPFPLQGQRSCIVEWSAGFGFD
jgi:hypothetical protein